MLLFIIRWFKGLIVGWMIGLILFMVRRIIARAFGNIQEAQNNATPPHRHQNDGSVIETIWAGMTTTQLTRTYGEPERKNKIGPDSEVWTYSNFEGSPLPTDVTIQHGKVTGWARAKADDSRLIPS